MTKRTIKETIREYDENGKVVKETVTETTENDDTQYWPYTTVNPCVVPMMEKPEWWEKGPTCTCKSE